MTALSSRPDPFARHSPAVSWWVWLADAQAGRAVLYPCKTEADAEALRAELASQSADRPGEKVIGRSQWPVNLHAACRVLAARGLTLGRVQE